MSKMSLSTKVILGGLVSALNVVSTVASWPPMPFNPPFNSTAPESDIPPGGVVGIGASVLAILVLGIYAIRKCANAPVPPPPGLAGLAAPLLGVQVEKDIPSKPACDGG